MTDTAWKPEPGMVRCNMQNEWSQVTTPTGHFPITWGICTVATLADVLTPGFVKYQGGGVMQGDFIDIIAEKNTEERVYAKAIITVARQNHAVEMQLKPDSEWMLTMPGVGPFQVLGLDKTASTAQIETAFKGLAAKRHPDKKGSTEAMQRLNKARADALVIVEDRAA